jgi:hypothetical protein
MTFGLEIPMPWLFACLLLIPGFLSSCGFVTIARVSVNTHLSPEDVAFIQRDQTTLAEIVSRLGTPDEITTSDEGLVAIYHFLDAKYSRVNYGLLMRIWSPANVDLITQGLGMGLESLAIRFNASLRVDQVEFAHFHDRPPGFRFWPFSSPAAADVS